MMRRVGDRVVVVGTVNLDLCFEVARLPAPDETLGGAAYSEAGGGKGANTAAAAAASGADCVLVAAVGDDRAGVDALEELDGYGVDTSAVVRIPGAPTGRAGIITAPVTNMIVVASGANAELGAERLTTALRSLGRETPTWCLVNGELPDELVEAAAGAAHELGWRVAYNASPARPLGPSMLAARALLVVNEVEARQLTGLDVERDAAAELASRHGRVVVTLGADGALVAEGGSVTEVPPTPVTPVDTVGAGDAFTGALLASLAAGAPLVEATRTGVEAGGRAVSHRGARGWLNS